MDNMFSRRDIKHIGYKTIWGLLWQVWRLDRQSRKTGVVTRLDVQLPVRPYPPY